MARGDGTRVIRAGLPAAERGEPFLPGPVLAAPYHSSGDPADAEFTVPEGFVRLSAGCEDGDDLVADVSGALAA